MRIEAIAIGRAIMYHHGTEGDCSWGVAKLTVAQKMIKNFNVKPWLFDVYSYILILVEDTGLCQADLSRLFWLADKDSRLSLRRTTRKMRPKMRWENAVSLAKLSII